VFEIVKNIAFIKMTMSKFYNFFEKKYYHFLQFDTFVMTSQFNYSHLIISKSCVYKSFKSTNQHFVNMSIMISTVQMFKCSNVQLCSTSIQSINLFVIVISKTRVHKLAKAANHRLINLSIIVPTVSLVYDVISNHQSFRNQPFEISNFNLLDYVNLLLYD
jgi:hypothetical protein